MSFFISCSHSARRNKCNLRNSKFHCPLSLHSQNHIPVLGSLQNYEVRGHWLSFVFQNLCGVGLLSGICTSLVLRLMMAASLLLQSCGKLGRALWGLLPWPTFQIVLLCSLFWTCGIQRFSPCVGPYPNTRDKDSHAFRFLKILLFS